MKIRKEAEGIYCIDKEGQMRVPLKVFASEEMLQALKEDRCLEQGMNVATLPGIRKQAIMMPDAHQGYGFPIGGVAAFSEEEGCISPGGIGYDINCGVRLITTNLDKLKTREKIEEILSLLFHYIPVGVGSKSKLKLSNSELDEVLNTGMEWALKNGYAEPSDLDHCEERGQMTTADSGKVSDRAKERGRPQLGTLGAGNHFIEIQYVDEIYDEKVASLFGISSLNQTALMIHSGSRGLGHQVCSDYIRKMEKGFREILSTLKDRELIYAPLNTPLAKDYFAAMSAAANFGWCNRQMMTYQARKAFREVFGPETELKLIYDVAHNIAKREEHEIDGKKEKVYVHRKGATRAFGPGREEIPEVFRQTGQPIIIPGSMGTASYLLVGTNKAMSETFGSTPHGAGRIMSRHKALKRFRGDQVKEELRKKDIHLKAGSLKGVAEEAPGVYKDIDQVVEIAHKTGIGSLVARLKPMGVIKG